MSETNDSDTKQCPYCAETIKAAATVCRYCGRDLVPQPAAAHATPPQKGSTWKTLGIALLAIIGLAFLNNFVQGFLGVAPATADQPAAEPTLTISQMQAQAVTLAFDDLARNTEQHQGKLLNLSGEIAQVLEDGDAANLRVNLDGDMSQMVVVHYPSYATARVLDGDTVQMIARVDGRVTYETVLNSEVTAPLLTALWLRVEKS